VVHAPAGAEGHTALFFQVLVDSSDAIRPLYQRSVSHGFRREYVIQATEDSRATKLEPYIAELFLPSSVSPFRTVTAGRELLIGHSSDGSDGK
jgi:hypothetical protein